jgi:ATP sulfurylase
LATGKQSSSIDLISPYGDRLVDLKVAEEAAVELREYASRLTSLRLSERAVCDLELLATGAFSPLDRFLGKADHERVLQELRLAHGKVFPIPVTLPLEDRSGVRLDVDVALRDSRNELLAVLTIEEIYEYDLEEVAACVLGTTDCVILSSRDASLGSLQCLRQFASNSTAAALRFRRVASQPQRSTQASRSARSPERCCLSDA